VILNINGARMFATRTLPLVTLATLMAAACSDSDPAGPDADEVQTLSVDASNKWAFVGFDGDAASTRAVADPSSSAAWDIGFFATSVMLNGGAAGPAGMVGYCLCANVSATDAEVMAMTAESELADFEAVSAAAIPSSEDDWTSDALAPAIDGWYSYNPSTHVVSAARENVWKVRTGSGDAYAKFHVTGLANGTQQHAGEVTFEYALQPSSGAAFEATRTETVDLASGPIHFDLETGSVVAATGEWDLLFDGYDIRVNGGVSGTGSAGASLSGASFNAITDASDLMASHYRGDAFGGVFDAHPWYRYNLDGGHQIWPTYDVFLIRRGDAVYKVQLTSYYGATGDSRQITFRYARLQ
jgi:hypothetical protein